MGMIIKKRTTKPNMEQIKVSFCLEIYNKL